MTPLKIAVLISGRGSNLKALAEACDNPEFPAQIEVVISNRPEAKGLDIARTYALNTSVIDHEAFDNRSDFETALNSELKGKDVSLICLAGFMRLLGADFVNGWRDRMINVHPSLLPSFRGLNTHERAVEAGVKFSGCTVHFVRPEMDDGPIIIQAAVPLKQGDTPEELAKRILIEEHKIYPKALEMIARGMLRMRGHHVIHTEEQKIPTSIINPV